MVRLTKPILIILSLGACLVPFTALGQRLPDTKKREVADIRFEGDSNISGLELQSIIATRTSEPVGRFLNSISSVLGTPRQYIDEAALAEDTIRIFVYLRDRGFFDAHVSYTLHESAESSKDWDSVSRRNSFLPPANRLPYPLIEDTVVFHITEGKPYKVFGFTFEGFETLPMDLQSKLTENIGIKPKSQYSKDALIKEITREKDILGENGYPFFSLASPLVEPDTIRKTVTISLKFKTGPRVRFGAAKIIYDTAYSASGYVLEKVVRRQMDIDSGAWYKNSDRLASERDVARLGTFQYVKIDFDTSVYKNIPDSARDGIALPVILNLRMRDSWDATIGFYPGLSAVFYQLILGIDVSYTNRNIGNAADNFTSQISYEFFPLNQHRGTIGSTYTFPVFPIFDIKNVPLILSGDFSYSDQVRTDNHSILQYLERSGNVSAGTNVQLTSDPSLIASWAPKGSLQYIVRDYRDSSIFGGQIDTTIKPQFNAIFSSDISYNWTNTLLNPSRGTYVLWSLQYAVPINVLNLPSAAYVKNTLQLKEFFDLGSSEGRSVLGFRIMGGLVSLTYQNEPTRDILIENRYYGGGTNSLRGWPARSLLVSNTTDYNRPYYGGYKTFEANLEWRYALFHYPAEITAVQQFLSPVHVGFFCDAGNVWDKDVPVAIRNFAVAVGTGLRYYISFVGAVRVDLGFKFYDPYPPVPPSGVFYSIPPNYSAGAWIFNRKGHVFHDTYNIEFALGQAF